VTAQTKLRALRAAIAAGKGAVRAKDNPTLADMELRLSQAREELRQLERRYTPAYLAREPQAVALKTKIPELENQIRREREASQQANLAEAEQEAQQTQEAVENLRRQLSGERQTAQSFAAHLSEYTALQAQLADLEKLQGGASERLVKLEAREGARRPKVRVIQSATVPGEPWRPNYHRDALIVLAGSLILAWLAAWLADFLLRRESGPTLIVAPAPMPYPVGVPELARREPAPALAPGAPAAQLPAPRHLPRDLEEAELGAQRARGALERRQPRGIDRASLERFRLRRRRCKNRSACAARNRARRRACPPVRRAEAKKKRAGPRRVSRRRGAPSSGVVDFLRGARRRPAAAGGDQSLGDPPRVHQLPRAPGHPLQRFGAHRRRAPRGSHRRLRHAAAGRQPASSRTDRPAPAGPQAI